MILISVAPVRDVWFGVAEHDGRLVATATGSDRDAATRSVINSLPRGSEHRIAETATGTALAMAFLLAGLESGEQESPVFELCPDCIGEPLASVAQVASAIPRGFVATYGGVAAAAGTEARVVGNIMATNPLYPIIPCHRVVGADFSLVGYTGRREPPALRRKLARLRDEARGATGIRSVTTPLAAMDLPVFPVERVLARAVRDGLDDGGQRSLW